jgi:hypothetical protein
MCLQTHLAGVLDSDGVIFSFLTKSTIFGPDGRIMIRALNSSSRCDVVLAASTAFRLALML